MTTYSKTPPSQMAFSSKICTYRKNREIPFSSQVLCKELILIQSIVLLFQKTRCCHRDHSVFLCLLFLLILFVQIFFVQFHIESNTRRITWILRIYTLYLYKSLPISPSLHTLLYIPQCFDRLHFRRPSCRCIGTE